MEESIKIIGSEDAQYWRALATSHQFSQKELS